ncbi:MAG: DNA topoisomerase I [Candidatus Bathyarchaeota archaeon]
MTKLGCIMIIAEKPDAAQHIAEALNDCGTIRKKTAGHSSYFVIHRKDKKILVVSSSGHLYTVAQENGNRNHYPVFTLKWVPKYLVEKNVARTKGIIRLISKLSHNADEFINAADYDIEGSLIGYMILKHACNGKHREAKRMKFSTLTKEDLNYAYENLMPHLDFALAEAGQVRHEIDWLYGVNLSRALTLSALKQRSKYRTLSIGRVQGPVLKLIVQREIEIRSFIPAVFWEIEAFSEIGKTEFRLQFAKAKIKSKIEAEKVKKTCNRKTGEITDIREAKVHIPPPYPFNLGTMQTEAYRFFGYMPRRTSDIAERLYLDALISYPRTFSQKLPSSINYKAVLEGLSKNPRYKKLVRSLPDEKNLKPNEGNKEDTAHPAIYPTGRLPERKLTNDESKVYDLVVKRFMATFSVPAVLLRTKVSVQCTGHIFFIKGSMIVKDGWIKIYQPYISSEEITLPNLQIGQRILFKKVKNVLHHTRQPPRYDPASLLKTMEKNNIGAKSTRADIIEILYKRGYIRNERMIATDIGFGVIETLRHCQEITSVELTRDLEDKMNMIAEGKENRKDVLMGFVEKLEPVLRQLRLRETDIGIELSEAIKLENLRNRIVGICPACRTGNLIILRSKKTGKRFIGCTNFFNGKCKEALPLPQKGKITITDKICKTCNSQIITVRLINQRPYRSCINPDCPTKKHSN